MTFYGVLWVSLNANELGLEGALHFMGAQQISVSKTFVNQLEIFRLGWLMQTFTYNSLFSSKKLMLGPTKVNNNWHISLLTFLSKSLDVECSDRCLHAFSWMSSWIPFILVTRTHILFAKPSILRLLEWAAASDTVNHQIFISTLANLGTESNTLTRVLLYLQNQWCLLRLGCPLQPIYPDWYKEHTKYTYFYQH